MNSFEPVKAAGSSGTQSDCRVRPERGWLHLACIIAALACACVALAGCSSSSQGSQDALDSPLAQFERSDMTGYPCMEGYTAETMFASVTMDDVDRLFDDGESFALYFGYDKCPWCNSMLTTLNDVARERGQLIAYMDTRADPSWSSNLDIDGYDIVVERFGSYLDEDDDGTPHLYVPHVFFVKDGEVVYEHDGTVPSQENSSDPLSEEQVDELASYFEDGFKAIE